MANQLLEIWNAKVIFKNFKGIAKTFNDEGSRNFCVILDDTQNNIDKMINDGWNVKILQPTVKYPNGGYILEVRVKFDKYPPVILIRKGNNPPVRFDESMVGELDGVNLSNISMKIYGREYKPGKLSTFLREFYADAEVNEMADAFINRGMQQ